MLQSSAPVERKPEVSRAVTVCAVLAMVLWTVAAGAQVSQRPEPTVDVGIAQAKTQAIAQRDAFVSAVAAAGGQCTIAPPAIKVEHVLSFGSYDEATNTLTTSAWELLTDDERARFTRLAGPSATPEMAQNQFESGVHHWVFAREMVGWWQACHPRSNEKPYLFEFETNRLITAYWREHDRSVIDNQRRVFEYVLSHVPSPLAEGQDIRAYYDAHYPDKFGGAMDYLWFQAHMCLDAFDERPAPSFSQVLQNDGLATHGKPQ